MPHITLVPTPIGNLEDITMRALRILKEADLIAAEDTRTSGKLLQHYQIETPKISLHQHNEHSKVPALLEKLIEEDLHLAVITDAGTPGISDPGFLLVREAIQHQIPIETLPGATAFVPALVNSGLPSDRFVFEGFLPVKKGRQSRLDQLAEETRTMVFYESPYRLVKTLQNFITKFGPERPACVCRELTKIHEETVRGSLEEVVDYFKDKNIKGEIVVIVSGQK
ncbi:MAG: 16S rRNA (cytidine(1402)-2'-O)-methyltransferase [Bacteroidetes bacterium]|nr:16S rRNA (cytidine(1402)-2'-O)-methyltransferase [Bacteroidota bacterium]MCB0844393.1 16S rRNA (cytidine(1402)-2'-O)-methyltransferase [Bacteroidota bacterium]